MSTNQLVISAAIVLWLAATYEVQLSWRRYQPGRRRLGLILALVALAATLWTDEVYAGLSRLAGVPSTADLIARIALLIGAWSAEALLTEMTADPAAAPTIARPAQRGVLRAAAVLTMLVLFFGAIAMGGTLRFTEVPEHDAAVSAYLLVFSAAMGWSILVVTRHAWRLSGTTDRALGLGLRAISLGCGTGLLYMLIKIVSVALVEVGRPMNVGFESALAKTTGALAGRLRGAGLHASRHSAPGQPRSAARHRAPVAARPLSPLGAASRGRSHGGSHRTDGTVEGRADGHGCGVPGSTGGSSRSTTGCSRCGRTSMRRCGDGWRTRQPPTGCLEPTVTPTSRRALCSLRWRPGEAGSGPVIGGALLWTAPAR